MGTDIRCAVAAATAAVLTGGCSSPGLLYTDVTRPLTLDMRETILTPDFALGTQNVIREPLTRAGLTAEWASQAPGLAARANGLDAINYADIRRQSVLGGLWARTMIVIYGTRAAEPVATAQPAVADR
jgi:hypothetical protein